MDGASRYIENNMKLITWTVSNYSNVWWCRVATRPSNTIVDIRLVFVNIPTYESEGSGGRGEQMNTGSCERRMRFTDGCQLFHQNILGTWDVKKNTKARGAEVTWEPIHRHTWQCISCTTCPVRVRGWQRVVQPADAWSQRPMDTYHIWWRRCVRVFALRLTKRHILFHHTQIFSFNNKISAYFAYEGLNSPNNSRSS